MTLKSGGYESGYAACDCFWGSEPGSYVVRLAQITGLVGLHVLDAGCGEGKNAGYLAERGASVIGIDISKRALQHAKILHPRESIAWMHADICQQSWAALNFDVVVAYGLFHCLSTSDDIEYLWRALSDATKIGGYHVICAFFRTVNEKFSGLPQSFAGKRAYILTTNPSDFELQLFSERKIEVIPVLGLDRTRAISDLLAELAS